MSTATIDAIQFQCNCPLITIIIHIFDPIHQLLKLSLNKSPFFLFSCCRWLWREIREHADKSAPLALLWLFEGGSWTLELLYHLFKRTTMFEKTVINLFHPPWRYFVQSLNVHSFNEDKLDQSGHLIRMQMMEYAWNWNRTPDPLFRIREMCCVMLPGPWFEWMTDYTL